MAKLMTAVRKLESLPLGTRLLIAKNNQIYTLVEGFGNFYFLDTVKSRLCFINETIDLNDNWENQFSINQ